MYPSAQFAPKTPLKCSDNANYTEAFIAGDVSKCKLIASVLGFMNNLVGLKTQFWLCDWKL